MNKCDLCKKTSDRLYYGPDTGLMRFMWGLCSKCVAPEMKTMDNQPDHVAIDRVMRAALEVAAVYRGGYLLEELRAALRACGLEPMAPPKPPGSGQPDPGALT